MGFYESRFGLLGALCVVLQIVEYRLSIRSTAGKVAADNEEGAGLGRVSASARQGVFRTLMQKYLLVYGLVMGADWLQGPYAYSLYAEQYDYPPRLVSYFFITGFLSGAFFAPFTGSLADQHGRKHVCLAFCVLYAASCILLQARWIPCILLARVLGGISASILFSVFESWLVSSHSETGLPSEDLSTILGRATILNGFIATITGVISNKLVDITGKSYRSPFIASALVLGISFVIIRRKWSENYGQVNARNDEDAFQISRLKTAVQIVMQDPSLLVLGMTQTLFEGSMYLFVFVWVPILQDSAYKPSFLPLGFIFSSFMVSMMLGSLIYTFITVYYFHAASKQESLALHVTLSSLLCGVASLSFAICVSTGIEKGSYQEHTRFWAFCMFEACVGIYYPVQGFLKGSLISNEHRATVTSLFRVPQNVFVVIAVLTGFSSARETVLFACAILLAVSALTSAIVMLPHIENQTAATSQHSLRI